ncbi:MAG: L-aspartate oxidase [Actinobacteria bacterium]|nr:L-aspartate oxidase [Actinomycetota bacterium]
MTDLGTSLDVLVVGSGVAGLTTAVHLSSSTGLRVGVLTKSELAQSATRWAQGGVAAVLGEDEDSTDLHLADTLAAGAGLCDFDAVRVLVDEGPDRVHELIALGAVFDRLPGGGFDLAREGGHSTARVVHAGGAATGAEVERALVSAVRRTAVAVLEGWFALDLIVEEGRCAGVTALDASGARSEVRADHVVLATGGAGQLFSVTTNPSEATGDGVAMALRAGVAVADVEFMQFHPTALHHPAMPRPLLSEALRGHGALLRDTNGDRFVDELAPRDAVSRAMAVRMQELGADHLWLDATGLEDFGGRFPTIAASLQKVGLDPSRDWLPIAPAAHYLSGGVVTDLHGACALPGLWAAGEVACTGVHGANRLASNSLLEGMVFGARVSEAIRAGKDGPSSSGAMRALLGPRGVRSLHKAGGSALYEDKVASETGGTFHGEIPACIVVGSVGYSASCSAGDLNQARTHSPKEKEQIRCRPDAPGWDGDLEGLPSKRDLLQRVMTSCVGVVRDERSLKRATAMISELPEVKVSSMESGELANLVSLAGALVRSALLREETRGAHARKDFPSSDPSWRCRIVHATLSGP